MCDQPSKEIDFLGGPGISKFNPHFIPHSRSRWDLFVLEIVPRLPQEQANTISKIKQNKIGF